MSEASKDLYGKVLILKNFEKIKNIKIIIVLASIGTQTSHKVVVFLVSGLQGTQLLCDSSVYQIAWDDLPPLLQKVATCDNDYSAVVADCGRTFRSKFIPVPSPLCEEFENGKSCIDEARQTHCSFDVQTLRTLKGNINPFCDNRTRPLFRDVGSCQSINQKLAFAVLIFSVMSCVSCR